MVERCPDKTEVLGPIPSTRTKAYSLFLMSINNENKIDKPWWRDGVIIFAKVSSYIVIPIIISSYLGKYLDVKYNTGNCIYFNLIVLSFLLTIYLIWRELKIYKKKMDSEEKIEDK